MNALEFHQFCVHQHDVVCNQKYDNRHPYSFHLECVRNEAIEWMDKFNCWSSVEREHIVMGCSGHDLIEDARITYNDIISLIGVKGDIIAGIIYACTEDKGRNRDERHGHRYYQLLHENKLAIFVKLCDIIANVKYSILTNSSMLDKYRKEHSKVCDNLYVDQYRDMFSYLDNLFSLNQLRIL